jgi:hypothetical protein
MTTAVKMVKPQIIETSPRDAIQCEADAQPSMKKVENGLDEIRFQEHSNW